MYLRQRVLARHIGALGPRVAYVGRSEPRLTDALGKRIAIRVDVAEGTGDARGAVVRGRLGELPIQGGALTGVLLADALSTDDEATLGRVCDDVMRTLQPGGALVILDRLSVGREVSDPGSAVDVSRLVAALGASGLEVAHRLALRRSGAAPALPRALWAISAWRDQRAASAPPRDDATTPADRDCAIVAHRPGGNAPRLPSAADLTRTWFFGGMADRDRPPRDRGPPEEPGPSG